MLWWDPTPFWIVLVHQTLVKNSTILDTLSLFRLFCERCLKNIKEVFRFSTKLDPGFIIYIFCDNGGSFSWQRQHLIQHANMYHVIWFECLEYFLTVSKEWNFYRYNQWWSQNLSRPQIGARIRDRPLSLTYHMPSMVLAVKETNLYN